MSELFTQIENDLRLAEQSPSESERRRRRELDRDLARHNERLYERLYAAHIGAPTRLGGRRWSWLARLLKGWW